MKLIYFHKAFPKLGVDELVEFAQRLGFEGYDLCCRDGYCVSPGNVMTELSRAVTRIIDKAGGAFDASDDWQYSKAFSQFSYLSLVVAPGSFGYVRRDACQQEVGDGLPRVGGFVGGSHCVDRRGAEVASATTDELQPTYDEGMRAG